MTFNTKEYENSRRNRKEVLNLVINGWPSILRHDYNNGFVSIDVLNLVINGWPSIQKKEKKINNKLFIH